MTTFQDMVAMNEKELQKNIEEAQRKTLETKVALVTGHEKDTSKGKKARKAIARLKTARRQQQLGISKI